MSHYNNKQYYVYILTNSTNNVLYTGMSSDLKRRIHEHREGITEGFTKRYNCSKLVYYEATSNPSSAITREKQIKGFSRKKKIDLIIGMNPDWIDLFDSILFIE